MINLKVFISYFSSLSENLEIQDRNCVFSPFWFARLFCLWMEGGGGGLGRTYPSLLASENGETKK